MTRARALLMAVVSAVTGYVVGGLAARARRGRRGVDSLAQDVERFGMEQAALRRVATLVALGAAPEEVFAAVTAEPPWSGTTPTAGPRSWERGAAPPPPTPHPSAPEQASGDTM